MSSLDQLLGSYSLGHVIRAGHQLSRLATEYEADVGRLEALDADPKVTALSRRILAAATEALRADPQPTSHASEIAISVAAVIRRVEAHVSSVFSAEELAELATRIPNPPRGRA
jgi:hypothetical protein